MIFVAVSSGATPGGGVNKGLKAHPRTRKKMKLKVKIKIKKDLVNVCECVLAPPPQDKILVAPLHVTVQKYLAYNYEKI